MNAAFGLDGLDDDGSGREQSAGGVLQRRPVILYRLDAAAGRILERQAHDVAERNAGGLTEIFVGG